MITVPEVVLLVLEPPRLCRHDDLNSHGPSGAARYRHETRVRSSVFADEDFAEYGLDERRIADLRNWVTGWYGDLGLRLVADVTDDEVPDDL